MSSIDAIKMFETLITQGYSGAEAFSEAVKLNQTHNLTKDELITEKDLKISNLELKEWINDKFKEVNGKLNKINIHIMAGYLIVLGFGISLGYIFQKLASIEKIIFDLITKL